MTAQPHADGGVPEPAELTAARTLIGTQKVLVERRSGVLIVTLNRPDARNSIDTETAWAIHAAMDQLDADPTLGAGVLTGAGTNFCAGMDLKAFLAGERPTVGRRGFAGIVEKPTVKPLIAAVEGAAVAGGFEIVLACDMVIAGDTARFGLPEVKLSLVAGGGGLMRLSRRIPLPIAMQWALQGDFVPAAEAARFGLVNSVVAAGTAVEAATAMAATIAQNGPLALAATKRILVECSDWSQTEEFARQREISEPVRGSQDAREGARAFAEKRTPNWTGH